jgi:exosortase/archaeosortase family protein
MNFINPLRFSLLWSAKSVLMALGHPSSFRDDFTLALQSGEGIRMVYSCIGYGVMSFWAAFVFANRGGFKRKTVWILGGLLALYLLNVVRMVLLLLSAKNTWDIPFGWDHHTWFNIAAYGAIFGMIYLYDRHFKERDSLKKNRTANQNEQALS